MYGNASLMYICIFLPTCCSLCLAPHVGTDGEVLCSVAPSLFSTSGWC